MKIDNRKDLFEYYESLLNNTYEKLRAGEDFEQGQNLLKTYLVESELADPRKMEPPLGYTSTVSKTNDPNLFKLKIKKEKQVADFYIDSRNKRFWTFHTDGKSSFTDSFILRSIRRPMNGLDHSWLSNSFLTDISSKYTFRGFSLKYDDKFEKKKKNEDLDVNKMSIKLWGTIAPEVINRLKGDPKLQHSIALSGVGIKNISEDSFDDFILDDINFWGKFTARGTSLDEHFSVFNHVRDKYNGDLSSAEKCWIEYPSSGNGIRVEGCPIKITLKKSIKDIDNFTQFLLSSRKPFRIWGVRNNIMEGYVKLNAIDLQTGGKVVMEICSDWLRIYLPKGSCGNIIFRLLTNIHHYYDSEAEVVIPNVQ